MPTTTRARSRPPHARIDRTLLAAAVLISLGLLAVVGRVAQLQLKPDAPLVAHMQSRMATRPMPTLRGELLDIRGRLLSTTRFGYRAFLDPVAFEHLSEGELDEAIISIAQAVGISPEVVADRLYPRLEENARRARIRETGIETDPPLRYVVIGGMLSDEQAETVRRLHIPGLHLEQRSIREYPGGQDVASIVGKVGFEHTGLLGAELALEDRLHETDGRIRYVRDARGNPLWVNPGDWQPGEPGSSVRLSIDLQIQRIAIEELTRGMEECDAAGGRCIVLDPHTGEILAMVDLTRPVEGAIPFQWEDASAPRVRAPAPDPRDMPRYIVFPQPEPGQPAPAIARNRCVEDVYEPGSTFKAFIWSVITERRLARIDEVFDTEGGRWLTSYGRKVEDVVRRPHMTWAEVLINSSNIGMVKAGERLTFDQLHDAVRRFGFGKPTGIGLPGEASGLVTSLKSWSKYTQTSVCFGYEVAVTPVQMVRAFSAFARSGSLAGTLPHLRLTAIDPNDPDPLVVPRVLPAEVALLTREIMAKVAENMQSRMTGKATPEEGWRYTMFGKSGTANIPLGRVPKGKRRPTGSRGYFEGQYNSSFIAAGPTEDPRLVILAIIDDPGPARVRARTHYGSYTAGPVVRRVMERSLAYLGVPPSPNSHLASAETR